MPDLPTGTVTFLFTDIEGSTKLWEQHPDAMRGAIARHNDIVSNVIESHDGHVFKTLGDGFCAAFIRPTDAVTAACRVQQAMVSETWQTPTPLRVRVALHVGEVEEHDGDYYGATVNRVARLLHAAHGGQVLLSQAIYELVRDALPEGVTLKDLGEYHLRDLIRPERIFQLVHPDLPAEFPFLRGLDSFPNNLPVQATSFVGREKELAEVKRLLTTTRLLTLTGVGGCGKTRLALQVGADLLEEYPDGVWLAELAALADPALVPQVVASVMGVREEPNRPLIHTLIDFLRPKRLLILLDNCEHLIDACAQLADALMKACPKVQIIASSREALGIAGEVSWRVPSLSAPEPKQLPPLERLTQYESVRLFVERAAAAKPGFAVTNENAPAVAQVCWRLDGIPLAIELAAARVRAMPVEQISARLDDRFRLLTGGSRTALPRQQTLRALIDWSYDLLSEQERMLLRRLSVFAGGWTLEAAEQVCAGDSIEEWETLDWLTHLVDKSLVIYEERNGQARYRLLETVRQYARDRLLESNEGVVVREKHRDYFLALAEQAEPEYQGRHQAAWLDRVEIEHDNLRFALQWSLDSGEAEPALRLAGSLWRFWEMHGYLTEGRERLAEALKGSGFWVLGSGEQPPEPRTQNLQPSTLAKALHGAGFLAYRQGDYAQARSLTEESLSLYQELGDQRGIAFAVNNLGNVAHSLGDYAQARALYEEALTIRRELGDKGLVASTLGNLGNVVHHLGDDTAARALYEEALAIRRELGDQAGIAWSLNSLGFVAQGEGDYGKATSLFEESIALYQQLGMKRSIADVLNSLGNITWRQYDYARSKAYYEEAQAIYQELGSRNGIALSFHNLANIAWHQGDIEKAKALFEESLTIWREMGTRVGVSDALCGLGNIALEQGDGARARALYEEALAIRQELGAKPHIANAVHNLGEAARFLGDYEQAKSLYEQSMATFQELGSKRGVSYGLQGWGFVAHHQGDNPQAAALFRESLTICQEQQNKRGIAIALTGCAAVAAGERQFERAARLFGAAAALLEEMGAYLEAIDRVEYERSMAVVRAALDEETFAAAWAEGRGMTVEEVVAYAMET